MTTFRIGDRLIGPDQPTYFIADTAANHDGSRPSSTAKRSAPDSTFTIFRTVAGAPGNPEAHSCTRRRVRLPIGIAPSSGTMCVSMMLSTPLRVVASRSPLSDSHVRNQSATVTRASEAVGVNDSGRSARKPPGITAKREASATPALRAAVVQQWHPRRAWTVPPPDRRM